MIYQRKKSNIVVIDTETNWADEVMSLGAVIADDHDFSAVDSRYYLISPEFQRGGMYSGALHMRSTPGEITLTRPELAAHLDEWLREYGVTAVFAYNAKFDRAHLPELAAWPWYDIMRVAAYRQYNDRIPLDAPCCRTGRLKTNYGVEPMYRLLSNRWGYREKHNGWHDAMDELKIMELLGVPLDGYACAEI